MLPATVIADLQRHLSRARLVHAQDLEQGFGEVEMPFALRGRVRAPRRLGSGSMYFCPATSRRIQDLGWCAGTTCPKPRSSVT
jgi:hypothetical protein